MRKVRKIIKIGLIVLFAISLICTYSIIIIPSIAKNAANAIVDERLSELNANNSPNGSNSQNNSSNGSNSQSNSSNWGKLPESNSYNNSSSDWNDNIPEIKIPTASIANTETLNGRKSFHELKIFNSYNDAYNNAEYLPSGRYVSIIFNATSPVEKIFAKVSMYKNDEDTFVEYNEFKFENTISSDGQEILLDFKIPGNPYVSGYDSQFTNIIIVFEITTSEGQFYVGCSY